MSLSSDNVYNLANCIAQACADVLLAESEYSVDPDSVVNLITLLCDGDQCTDCLLVYFDEDMITGQNYWLNIDLINEVRNAACYDLCVCSASSITQDTTVLISTNYVESSVTEDQMADILSRASELYGQDIDTDYGMALLNTSLDEIQISLTTLVNASSVITSENGDLHHINTKIYVNIIIDILLKQTYLQDINTKYSQGLADIIAFQETTKSAFETNKTLLILLGAILAAVLSVYLGLWVYRYVHTSL
jgi:hypothetical protein